MKIAHRITVWVLAASFLVIIPTLYFSYQAFFSGLRKQYENIRPLFTQSIETNIVRQNTSIETITKIATFEILAGTTKSPEGFKNFLALCIRENSAIYGMSLAFESEDEGSSRDAWYMYRKSDDPNAPLGWINLDSETGAPHFTEREWFAVPKRTRNTHWTKPYTGTASGVPMVTFSAPLIDKDGHFFGTVACDVSLSWLDGYFKDIETPNPTIEQMFLLAGDGTVLADRNWGMGHANVLDFADKHNDKNLRNISERMLSGEIGDMEYRSPDRKIKGNIIFLPVDEHDGDDIREWSLGIFVPTELMRGQAFKVGQQQAAIAFSGLIMLVFAIRFVARGISFPIRKLQESALDIASGNLETKIPRMRWKDEISELAESLKRMQEDLKANMERIANATRERERMDSDLRIAHKIQMNQVPRHLPETKFSENFDLSASIEPAREVGGDFYDYLMIDDETICLVIADVSGKGVPAALLMARSSALFRSYMINGHRLGPALEHVNKELCLENESNMFVTLFAMTVHLPSGECRYVNAGHNPPFVLRKNRSPEMMPEAKSVPLGIDDETAYPEETLVLNAGDAVYLYTDGVSEAIDSKSGLFGNDRTLDSLAKVNGNSCESILEKVRKSISEFVEDTPQSDDITMLAFRRTGN